MQPIRWGLIGAGDIAERRVAPALAGARESWLVAVSRRRADLADAFAQRFGARVHADWRDLVRDAEIDAVYIATPVNLHAGMTIAAAEAGKHVLCEKPMALTVAECDAMLRAAESAGVKLGVAYYRRLYPVVQRIARLLAEGAIGVPVLAQADAFGRFEPSPDFPREWLLDPAQAGGGPMMDFGCHRIEVLLSLFGEVAAVGAQRGNVVYDRAVEDTAIATLRFPRGPMGIVTVTHAAEEPRDSLDIYGSRGSIHLESLNGEVLRLIRSGVETRESHPHADNAHLPLVEQFNDALRTGGEPLIDGAMGRAVNAVLETVYR